MNNSTYKNDIARDENLGGFFPALIICEHASNNIPPELSNLGLEAEALDSHIAWDPGALSVAQGLSRQMNAPLIYATISRLVIDLNRNPEAFDSIVETSGGTLVPSNAALNDVERQRRIRDIYEPFHLHVDQFLNKRATTKPVKAVISIHSFTPVYFGNKRPWHLGLIHDKDDRLTKNVLANLSKDPALTIGINEPYSPSHGVYHTLDLHACRRKLAPLMLEIRNDLIGNGKAQDEMVSRLGPVLVDAIRAL